MVDYRKRMRELREERGLTQTQVGAFLGKSQQGYNHIEAGRAELKIEDMIRLCRLYGVTADDFVGMNTVTDVTEKPA